MAKVHLALGLGYPNLCPNPLLEEDASGWSYSSSTAASGTRIMVTPGSVDGDPGFDHPLARFAYRIRWFDVDIAPRAYLPHAAVTPGQSITFSVDWKNPGAYLGSADIKIQWYDGNTYLGTATPDTHEPAELTGANTVDRWLRSYTKVTVPSGANTARVLVDCIGMDGDDTYLTNARYIVNGPIGTKNELS